MLKKLLNLLKNYIQIGYNFLMIIKKELVDIQEIFDIFLIIK